MKHRLPICLFLITLAVFAATEYRLGGGALAKIDETDASLYHCLVIFSPVVTMDAISNREMNRLMAQFLAEEALEKHLGKPCAVAFSRTSSSIKDMSKTLEYVFDIPKNAISFDVKVVTSSETDEKRPLSREDARRMILAERSSCFRDVTLAEAYLASLTKEPLDKRRREELITMLKKLEDSIDEDDNLFTREKRELKQRVRKLKATVQRK